MRSKKIKFAVVPEIEYANVPLPSKNYIPEWYKKLKPYTKGKITLKSQGDAVSGEAQKTLKKCVPFMDPFISGYIFETWCDIEITTKVVNGEETYGVSWLDTEWGFVSDRPQTEGLVVPDSYYQNKLALKTPFFVKTPPGYSVIVGQPYNRYDLPFLVLTGIVDADKYPLFPGNFPIYIKKGFSGIIPKGTPLVQIFPYKRESWKSEKSLSLAKEGRLAKKMVLSVISDWYRNNAWSKKSYE
jgi:hypothetical protein